VKTEGSLGGKKNWRRKIVTSNRRELTYTPLGGSLWKGEGNGHYRNATILVNIPGSIPGNYGKSHLCLKREIIIDLTLHFHISCVGRDDFAKLNRNASAANLIQIRPSTFPPSREC